jgi:hypothetical protein
VSGLPNPVSGRRDALSGCRNAVSGRRDAMSDGADDLSAGGHAGNSIPCCPFDRSSGCGRLVGWYSTAAARSLMPRCKVRKHDNGARVAAWPPSFFPVEFPVEE